ncbi:Alpha/Beta hydrolase protein [Cantharellus anzutake]|uniref:Alpha/Beta hydrolase protein n=1 Tax=Cantharellus anzutake TaxID=1750568 RepID=UPI001902F5EF|nr:Alpha/Beta hydrolase protein [Cantharellus anzutake]KAF8328842.1 Alpha/Beta hydrolase protein [Cantharellus anzutake]
MTWDAYLSPKDTTWYDLGNGWNVSYPVGWEPGSDGFRGHVFATPDNSTIVLGIKGTSAGFMGGGGPTARKDKLNDNLLWSCSLAEDSLFYSVGTNLYNNLTYMYPHSNIWITGHSLGGGLASLLGITFGVPAVAFESPGDKAAAEHLHLPMPPSTHHVTHVYHNADPVPLGACTGPLSSCYLAGFALETHCHLGRSIVYDTVGKLGWSVNIQNHQLSVIINDVLTLPWDVPNAIPEDDCVECHSWEFGDYNKTMVDNRPLAWESSLDHR